MNISKHYSSERKERQYVVDLIGNGKIVAKFRWDRHHPNGPEIHCIISTGIINIYNALSGKFVTSLIARPAQIRRYFEAVGKETPEYLINIAIEHQKMGYNNC